MAESVLDIEVQAEPQRVVLVLSGEIDMGSASTLRTCIQHLDQAWKCVVLDMGGVTFMDSSGIAVIAFANRELSSQYRQLQLRDLPDRVQMVLEITGVLEDLTMAPVDAAADPPEPAAIA